jgi:hypothetical protein
MYIVKNFHEGFLINVLGFVGRAGITPTNTHQFAFVKIIKGSLGFSVIILAGSD